MQTIHVYTGQKHAVLVTMSDVVRHTVSRSIQSPYDFITCDIRPAERKSALTLTFDFAHRSCDDSLIDFKKLPEGGKGDDAEVIY